MRCESNQVMTDFYTEFAFADRNASPDDAAVSVDTDLPQKVHVTKTCCEGLVAAVSIRRSTSNSALDQTH